MRAGQTLRGAGRLAVGGALSTALIAAVAPLVAAEDFEDASGNYRVTLPKRWKAVAVDDRDVFAAYEGWFSVPTDEPDGVLLIKAFHGYARAELAHHALHVSAGLIEPDTYTSGDGFAQSCGLAGTPTVGRFARYASCDDGVLVAEMQFGGEMVGVYDRKIEKVLDSFVAKRLPAWKAPDGFTSRPGLKVPVWSDVKRKRTVVDAAKPVLAGWSLMMELVPGTPCRGGRPRIVVFAERQAFETSGSPSVAAGYAYTEVQSGAVHVCGSSLKKKEAIVEMWRAGAAAYLHEYLGGTAPPWLEAGLTQYVAVALESRGKFERPGRARATEARESVESGGRTLPEWLDGVQWRVFSDDDGALAEAWAWCWYLRHQAAQPARNAFEAYIAALRDEGDPAGALEAWRDVDTASLTTDFTKWIESWRP